MIKLTWLRKSVDDLSHPQRDGPSSRLEEDLKREKRAALPLGNYEAHQLLGPLRPSREHELVAVVDSRVSSRPEKSLRDSSSRRFCCSSSVSVQAACPARATGGRFRIEIHGTLLTLSRAYASNLALTEPRNVARTGTSPQAPR